MDRQAVIEVKNLIKIFRTGKKTARAVDDISFTVREGEIVGLLGPNGAGKTTTIQMILGLIKPNGGVIDIFGMPISNHRQEILQQVGFATTYLAMQGKLTLRENLLIYSYLYNLKNKREKIEKALAAVDLSEQGGEKFWSLSSGQKTRAILAKALLSRPKLIILDEPTASLDPDIADRVQDLLIRICEDYQVTILYTSHNMYEVAKVCDRIIFLNKGKIVLTGAPEDIIDNMNKENLHEVFISLTKDN